MDAGTIPFLDGDAAFLQQGWKAALDLIPMKRSNSVEGIPSQASKNDFL